jgi:lipoprotein-anchoring transpeptidase ErfK/SrfK
VRKAWSGIALALVVAIGLSGCQGGGAGKTAGGAQASASKSATASPEPSVTFMPAAQAAAVRPDQQVQVSAERGTLTGVTVTSTDGKAVTGELAAGATSWSSSGALALGTSYTITAQVTSESGKTSTQTSTFSTLKPSSTMSAVLIPGDDWTVGVGMPIVVQFGGTVKNKEAAVKALTVTTTPQVEGAWHWMNGQAVWWRPKDFWPAGTKVKVTAAIDGAELAPGTWGRRTYTSQFSIGSAVVSTVDVQKHTMTVTKGGSVVRVLPVTTGKTGFLTRGGTKVIMEKLESVRMNAATTGTDPKDPEFYDEIEHWAMRLTWSGEYLHARPGSDWAFGKVNVSHGCTGLSNSNAKWLFDFSKIGDVVKYTGSSRPLEWGNGYTAWDMSYDKWAAGTDAA